jgi:hypothetical protein
LFVVALYFNCCCFILQADELNSLLELKRAGDTADRPRNPVLEKFYLDANLAEAAKRIEKRFEANKDYFDKFIAESILLNISNTKETT